MACSKFIASSEAETEKIGEQFAKRLKPGTIVALMGGMGMGKTAITRGIARGLGFSGRVTSPTYAIVNEYPSDIPLFHFDLFRLGDADELYDIGFEEYLERDGVLVIEWFERAREICTPDFTVTLEKIGDNSREITIEEAL